MGEGGLPGPEDRIFGIVRQMLPAAAAASRLGPDQSLLDIGLKSLDMVTLMLAVEAEFEVEIPQNKMTPANFQSVAAIHALVASLSPA
jgi:acyl carrier protein